MPTISADAGGAGGALGTGGTGAYWYDGGIAEVPVEPEPTHQMSLSVGQGVDGHGSPFGRIRATLATFEPSELPLVRRVGDCELTDFREFDGYTRFTPTVADIQIKDGHDDPIVLEPNLMPLCMVSHDLYTYDVPAEDWPRWSEGDRLLVIAQGSHVHSIQHGSCLFPAKCTYLRSSINDLLKVACPFCITTEIFGCSGHPLSILSLCRSCSTIQIRLEGWPTACSVPSRVTPDSAASRARCSRTSIRMMCWHRERLEPRHT